MHARADAARRARSGALEGIATPSLVAKAVMDYTDHIFLVGAGAKQFALEMGFKEQDLLTEKSRQDWLRWKANLNKDDNWLDHDDDVAIKFTTGTINMSAVTATGDIATVTTTSGLSWKIPGRVGDSADRWRRGLLRQPRRRGRFDGARRSEHQGVRRLPDGGVHAPGDVAAAGVPEDAGARDRDDGEAAARRPGAAAVRAAVSTRWPRTVRYGSACDVRRVTQFAVADAAGARIEDCAFLFAEGRAAEGLSRVRVRVASVRVSGGRREPARDPGATRFKPRGGRIHAASLSLRTGVAAPAPASRLRSRDRLAGVEFPPQLRTRALARRSLVRGAGAHGGEVGEGGVRGVPDLEYRRIALRGLAVLAERGVGLGESDERRGAPRRARERELELDARIGGAMRGEEQFAQELVRRLDRLRRAEGDRQRVVERGGGRHVRQGARGVAIGEARRRARSSRARIGV